MLPHGSRGDEHVELQDQFIGNPLLAHVGFSRSIRQIRLRRLPGRAGRPRLRGRRGVKPNRFQNGVR